jgi:hypothetical protein
MFTVVKRKLILCSVTLHKKTLTLEKDYTFESQKLRQALVLISIGRQLSAPHPSLAFTFAPLAGGSLLRICIYLLTRCSLLRECFELTFS